jgi:hypothetical protein
MVDPFLPASDVTNINGERLGSLAEIAPARADPEYYSSGVIPRSREPEDARLRAPHIGPTRNLFAYVTDGGAGRGKFFQQLAGGAIRLIWIGMNRFELGSYMSETRLQSHCLSARLAPLLYAMIS